MAIKMSDFLQAYLKSNHDIDDLDVWIYQPSTEIEGEKSYQVKKSLRNYLLFGNYYIEDITIDYYPQEIGRNLLLSINIVKEPQDVYQSCPFAYK